MVPVIGIVGGIGSGKSLVAAEFAKRGGHLILGDQLGHEALRDPNNKRRIVERWGPEVLDEKSEVDRRKFGRRVFADPEELKALEAISFPYIEGRIRDEILRGKELPGVRFIVLDAAIMLETGWAIVCDQIVFVDAPRELRLRRLQQTRGWSEEEVTRREQAQLPVEEKRRHADAVLDNAGRPEDVGRQVQELLAAWGL